MLLPSLLPLKKTMTQGVVWQGEFSEKAGLLAFIVVLPLLDCLPDLLPWDCPGAMAGVAQRDAGDVVLETEGSTGATAVPGCFPPYP